MTSLLVSVEGIDCSGKSSAINMLKETYSIVTTREPGGTPIGEELRTLILQNGNVISSETEALLFYTARVEHCKAFIKPNLDAGNVVVCDRYYDSSLAYQGANGNTFTKTLHEFMLRENVILRPNYTLLFDISIETYLKRKTARGVVKGEEINHIEDRDVVIYEKTLAIFRELAREEPNRFIVVDANQDIQTVHNQVTAIFDKLGVPRKLG